MGCVYLARCKENGKGYVGKTIGIFREYILGYRRESISNEPTNRLIIKAVRKYGFDAFEWSVLSEDDDEDWLFLMEQKWIKRLGTKMPNGYNMTDGGEGLSGLEFSLEHRKNLGVAHRGRKRSREAIEKTIVANTGRKNTEETKTKMSIAAKNRGPVTDETRRILSESHMGIRRSPESRIKQSLSARGKPKPPRTAEHKAKIAESVRRYYAERKKAG